jgi:hypothetical protein
MVLVVVGVVDAGVVVVDLAEVAVVEAVAPPLPFRCVVTDAVFQFQPLVGTGSLSGSVGAGMVVLVVLVDPAVVKPIAVLTPSRASVES